MFSMLTGFAPLWLRNAAIMALTFAAIAPSAAPRAQDVRSDEPLREVRVAEAAFVRGAPLPVWTQPLAEIQPTTRTNPVVIRLAETQVRVDRTETYFVHRAVLVNSAAALGQVGQLQIGFVPQYQKVELHRLEVIRDGKALDRLAGAGVRFLQRETGLESGVYSGTVTASILVDDLRVGDTLAFAYSIQGANPVFGGRYSGSVSWDQPDPVELRRVRFSAPADRKIAWKMHGDYRTERVEPRETVEDGMRTLVFEARAIEGLEGEPGVPSDYVSHRLLQFSEYRNWNEVARWADALFPPVASLPTALEPVVASMRTLATPEEKTVAALRWVQDEIRYFSVSLGESSHRPYPPDQVIARRYGDCKDKTYLLVTLLRKLDIAARPVLVSTAYPWGARRVLPAPDGFDHVVAEVRIGRARYYLDPTRSGQQGLLAGMGNSLAGADGLPVASDADGLIALNSSSAADVATQDLTEEFDLRDFGKDASLHVRRVFRGLAAEIVRLVHAQSTAEQRARQALAPYERMYPGIVLESAPEFTDDRVSNVITLSSRFRIPNLARETPQGWSFRYFPDNLRGALNLPQATARRFPAEVSNGVYRGRYEMRVTWPASVSVLRDPRRWRVSSDAFVALVTHSFRGNVASSTVDFTTQRSVILPAKFAALSEQLRTLDRAIVGVVSVPRNALMDPRLGEAPPSLRQTLVARLEQRVRAASKALEGANLAADDRADTLCDRAEAQAELGRHAEAAKDAAEAVRVAPENPHAWSCKGSVAFNAGDFARSVADYGRALRLGGNAFTVHYRRGHARFYAGQFAAAADDFERAASTSREDNEADRDYAALWWAWALRRAGKPLPASLVEKARASTSGPWPRPALALLVGAIDVDGVLAALEKKQGDERAMGLAEGWFYIGQHYAAEGRSDLALEAFRKAHALEVIVYIEHVAAGFEIAKAGSGTAAITTAAPTEAKRD